ncbi:MAG: glycosyltransferase family 4 protein [Luteolibacter sp.]
MSNRSIIVFAQVPPPEHGQSRMVAEMLRALRDSGMGDAVHHVDARFSLSMDDIGERSIRKLLLSFRYVFACLRLRVRLQNPALYYVPGPVRWSPVIRDWMLLAAMRPWFPQIIFHWHAIGQGEWAHGSPRLRLPGPRWLDRCARLVSRALLHAPAFSIAVSRNSTKDAHAIGSREILVIPNGIADPWPDFESRIRAHRMQRVKKLIENPAEPLRLLFLSRGTVEKGLPDALDAIDTWLSDIAHTSRPIHLTIAGGMDATTRTIVSEFREVMDTKHGQRLRCEVLDFITGSVKRDCYEQADLFLAPSHWESFGLTVAEALAAGLPVVAAASDGVSGVLPDGYPYLSPVRDTLQFAQNLRKASGLLTTPEYPEFIDSLRRHFVDHYTDASFARAIHELFFNHCFAEATIQRRKAQTEDPEPGVRGQGSSALSPLSPITAHRPSGSVSSSTNRPSDSDVDFRLSDFRHFNHSHSRPSTLPISISIYLADQNPKLGRSLGISRMTEVVMREMCRRPRLWMRGLASRSSIDAGDVMVSRVLPWQTKGWVLRVMTDHLHPLLSLDDRPDVWYYPKGFLPAMHNLCTPSVVTIHDTIVQYYGDRYPHWRYNMEYRYWTHMLRHTLTNADHILTVSETSKRHILAFMARHGIGAKEITVTYEPCIYECVPQPVGPEKGDYVLHLASREPHKRTEWLVDWWLAPENAGLPVLHLVGRLPDALTKRVAASDRIRRLSFLDDGGLRAQFMGARALIFPSEIEGFGLPAIEAYYLGTPVCFVKDTSVEEILACATAACGFHLDDPATLRPAIDEALAMPADEIRRIGLKLRETYAAEKVVDRIVAVFEEAAAG